MIDFTLPAAELISRLRSAKNIRVPSWDKLRRAYDPEQHAICTDTTTRRDRRRKDHVERAARLRIGLEKLLCNRLNEFMFTIPVKRIYHHDNTDELLSQIAHAVEQVYKAAHINAENRRRGLAYIASCEAVTIWYAVQKPHNLYGFPCDYKLKCKTFSPMDGTRIYPYFDELDDLEALSFEYQREDAEGSTTTYFECYTAEARYRWRRDSQAGDWEADLVREDAEGNRIIGEPNALGKIPAIYIHRAQPVYTPDMSVLREDLEYTLSRDSDVVAYNAAPVLKVSGSVTGEEQKGESRRIYHVENGGDVAYVSWNQSTEANSNHVNALLKFFWQAGQMPDISFDRMASLGNIGFDARQTLLTDAHLKVGDEATAWQEFYEREFSVILAFLKLLRTDWAEAISSLSCDHIITPYIQNDEAAEIARRIQANGGHPIESQLESIQRYGKSSNPRATLEAIQADEAAQQERQAGSYAQLFGS